MKSKFKQKEPDMCNTCKDLPNCEMACLAWLLANVEPKDWDPATKKLVGIKE